MTIDLTAQEVTLLANKSIPFDGSYDYADEEALELLDQVRDAEVSYSQGTDAQSVRLYEQYGDLADKLFALIP